MFNFIHNFIWVTETINIYVPSMYLQWQVCNCGHHEGWSSMKNKAIDITYNSYQEKTYIQ